MRVVLYTRDLEPITIIEMPLWLLEQLERAGQVKVAVREPIQKQLLTDPSELKQPETLDIYCEKLRWRDGTLKSILVVSNDELALALKPEWLPGQLQAIKWYESAISQLVDTLKQKFKKGDLDH